MEIGGIRRKVFRMVHRSKPARYALYVLFGVAALVGLSGFLAPRRMTVTRTITIHAPVETVFDCIHSLRRWTDWAPWFTRNPFLESVWDGPESGRGARVRSTGRNESFSLAVTGSSLHRTVFVAMDFGELGESASTFVMTDHAEDTTEVTWQFETDFGWNTSRRLFGLLYRHSIAEQIDSGLEALRQVCEAEARNPARDDRGPEGERAAGADADQASGPR